MSTIRVNALCIFTHNRCVLAQPGIDINTGESFYRLLGGGVEFGESSEQAIVREMREEIGASIDTLEKLDVIENIFQYQNTTYHEITFLYKGDIKEESFFNTKKIPILDKDAYAEWVSIQDILSGALILYPKQSRNYLI